MVRARYLGMAFLGVLLGQPVLAGPCHEWARRTPVDIVAAPKAGVRVEWGEQETKAFLRELLEQLGRPAEAYDLENRVEDMAARGPRWFLRSRSPVWPSLAIETVNRTAEGCLVVQASWWGEVPEPLYEEELEPMSLVMWSAGRELWWAETTRSCLWRKSMEEFVSIPLLCEEISSGEMEFRPSLLDYVVTETPTECAVLGLVPFEPHDKIVVVPASRIPLSVPREVIIPSQEELAQRGSGPPRRSSLKVHDRLFFVGVLRGTISSAERAACVALAVFPKDPATGRCGGRPMLVVGGRLGADGGEKRASGEEEPSGGEAVSGNYRDEESVR